MTKTERALSYIALAAALALGYTLGHRKTEQAIGTDTVRVEYTTSGWRTDTIIKPDTVRVLATRTVRVAVTDTVHHTDTIAIQAEQREYHGDGWRVWASGVGVELDSVSVRRDTVHVTETVTKTVRKAAPRLSVGLQVGVGATPRGVLPYAGVGVSWRVFGK